MYPSPCAQLNGAAATPYTYTPGTHHLATVGGTARNYDLNGNTQTGVASGFTFTYDDKNRFATATKGLTSATYQTNGRGERVRKVSTVGSATTTEYVYDEGGQLLGEYSSTGTAQVEYFYIDTTLIGVKQGPTNFYVETDHLGTPRQLIDPTRNVAVWKWDALASTFGTNAPSTDPDGDGTKITFNLRFPGQYFDAETGLAHNGWRDYESGTGRYPESDPIGILGGYLLYGASRSDTNTYSYVRNRPLWTVDSFGLTDGVCGYDSHFVKDPGSEGVGLQGHCEPDAYPDLDRKPMCAAGVEDCLILDGTNPHRMDGPSLCEYDRLGNNICYRACMAGDGDGGPNIPYKQIGRVAGRVGGQIGEAIDIGTWLWTKYRHHARCLKQCNIR